MAQEEHNETTQQNMQVGNCTEWLMEIRNRQQQFVTPQIREKMKEKAKKQQVRGHKMKRAAQFYHASSVQRNVLGNAFRFGGSARQAQDQLRNMNNNLWRGNERARGKGRPMQVNYENNSLFGQQAAQFDEQVYAMENANEDDIEINDENIKTLLGSLKIEPKNDEEICSKFGLYEEFLNTVEESRKATYEFWNDCKIDFLEGNAEHVMNSIEKSIKDIDKQDNLGIVFESRNWFVYDMTIKADSNNEKLKNCLHNIEIKLELLGKDDDCPFCLESGKESVTLGCCHKACKECWTHWQELKGMRAFCPLCRQEEFLEDMAVEETEN